MSSSNQSSKFLHKNESVFILQAYNIFELVCSSTACQEHKGTDQQNLALDKDRTFFLKKKGQQKQ